MKYQYSLFLIFLLFFNCCDKNIITLINDDARIEIIKIVNNSFATENYPFYLEKEDVIYFFTNAKKVDFTEINNSCMILDSYVSGKIYSNDMEFEFKIQLIDFGMIKYKDNIEWYICDNFEEHIWKKYYTDDLY